MQPSSSLVFLIGAGPSCGAVLGEPHTLVAVNYRNGTAHRKPDMIVSGDWKYLRDNDGVMPLKDPPWVPLSDRTKRPLSFSGTRALCRFVEQGDVVLAGFDLSEPEYQIQIHEWSAVKLWLKKRGLRRVWCHPAMTGPLTALWPRWRG